VDGVSPFHVLSVVSTAEAVTLVGAETQMSLRAHLNP
jgi:hypothetical protein